MTPIPTPRDLPSLTPADEAPAHRSIEADLTADPGARLRALLTELADVRPAVSAGIWIERADGLRRLDLPGELPASSCPVDAGVMAWALDRQTTVHATGSPDGRAVMAVPFTSAGHERGVLLVWRHQPGAGFPLGVSRLAAIMAPRAAQIVDEARHATLVADRERAVRDRSFAGRLRQRLLQPGPCELPPGVAVSGFSRASRHAAGDFHDILAVSRGELDLVAGHARASGASASLLAAATRMTLLRAMTQSSPRGPSRPADLVAEAAHLLAADLDASESQVTLTYLRLDARARCLSVVDAGQGGAWILGRRGKARQITSCDPPLGRQRLAGFRSVDALLMPGDRVVLWTHGLLRASDLAGRAFGVERVLQVLRAHGSAPVDAQVTAVRDAVDAFTGRETADDDQTLIVARLT
jgi:serine phosphatase RsbU (regulator of sigma subunit)